VRTIVMCCLLTCLLAVSIGSADATGTARVQRRDGSVQIYTAVCITVGNGSTSSVAPAYDTSRIPLRLFKSSLFYKGFQRI
jgi:hypothetical protein